MKIDFKIKKSKGFTLLELLIVIAIIGILSSIVVSSMNNAREKGQISKVEQELQSIKTAMEMMQIDTDEWPGHQTPFEINTGSDNEIENITGSTAGLAGTDGVYPNWQGPYIIQDIVDPWGNYYFFDTDYDLNRGVGPVVNGAVIGSYGPNGVGNNVYDSDDIIKVLAQ